MNDLKNSTDEHLMSLIQNGNEEAFNEIYLRYNKRILLFLYKMLKQDEAKAQDFLQDVFLKVVSSPEKFDTGKNFKTWIFTISANLCKNEFRDRKKHVELTVIKDRTNTLFFEPTDRELFKKELNQKLNQMPIVYKETFILRYYEGLALQEIATVSNCPIGTVKSRLHSALGILSKKLIHYQPN